MPSTRYKWLKKLHLLKQDKRNDLKSFNLVYFYSKSNKKNHHQINK